jgi:cytochrome c oxidase subunit 2
VAGSGQSVLTPHSGPEHSITTLWWVMFGVACIGMTLIATLLLLGWIHRNRDSLPFGGGERAATRLVVGLGIATPIVLLSALFVWSDVFVIRSTAAPSPSSTAMTIEVIGHQWFWEIRYDNGRIATANELHIPLRTRVNVVGTTADVIHSLWVPELNRKIDLIPGRTNRVLLYADRPGTYLGQCAEFCGVEHAHMELIVVAEPRPRFDSWLRTEGTPVRSAATGDGLRLFMSDGCANCHAIQGTPAQAHVGPDLTHVGSRTTLAAGTIPNDPAHLAAWIHDPQEIKPGTKMPKLPLSQSDVSGLVAYLEGLK